MQGSRGKIGIVQNETISCYLHQSASTFSPDFLRGIERFRALGADRVAEGAVLYNGAQDFVVRGVRAFNPLRAEDL